MSTYDGHLFENRRKYYQSLTNKITNEKKQQTLIPSLKYNKIYQYQRLLSFMHNKNRNYYLTYLVTLMRIA